MKLLGVTVNDDPFQRHNVPPPPAMNASPVELMHTSFRASVVPSDTFENVVPLPCHTAPLRPTAMMNRAVPPALNTATDWSVSEMPEICVNALPSKRSNPFVAAIHTSLVLTGITRLNAMGRSMCAENFCHVPFWNTASAGLLTIVPATTWLVSKLAA